MAQKAELKGKINLDSSGFQRGIAQSKKSVGTFVSTLKGSLLPALGAAGAAGALIRFGSAAMESAKEIKTLAKLSGTGVVEFQKLADAAKTVGIEQDKLADIFKDTSDKVGDFLESGGGPLADFFENIAPSVGATREEFIGLTGPEALQKYFDYLVAAELPHERMVFYMEAIASDATALIPLLENGGEAFKLLGDGAEEAGRVMDENTIEALARSKIAFERFGTFVKVQTGKLLAFFMNIGSEFEELAKRQLEAEGAFSGLVGGAGQQKRKQLIAERVALLKEEAEAREEALKAALAALDAEAKAARETEGAEKARKLEQEKRLHEAKLALLEAQATQNEELIQQAENQLDLEERVQRIMQDANVDRETAIRLAKELQSIEAGADADKSGYISPREQRKFDREQKKRDQERRKRERQERSDEVGEDQRRRDEERDKRMSEREKNAGFGPGADKGKEADGAKGETPEDKDDTSDLNETAKEIAKNTSDLVTTIKENP